MTTYFVGGHYIIPLWDEVTGSQITKHYGVYGANGATGAQRIAMRQGATLSYLLTAIWEARASPPTPAEVWYRVNCTRRGEKLPTAAPTKLLGE